MIPKTTVSMIFLLNLYNYMVKVKCYYRNQYLQTTVS